MIILKREIHLMKNGFSCFIDVILTVACAHIFLGLVLILVASLILLFSHLKLCIVTEIYKITVLVIN